MRKAETFSGHATLPGDAALSPCDDPARMMGRMVRPFGGLRAYGRVFAATYLATMTLLAIGVVVGLTDFESAGWSLMLVVVGVFTLGVLAFALERHDRRNNARRSFAFFPLSAYQVAWGRLATGVEVRRSWRILRGVEPSVEWAASDPTTRSSR